MLTRALGVNQVRDMMDVPVPMRPLVEVLRKKQALVSSPCLGFPVRRPTFTLVVALCMRHAPLQIETGSQSILRC